MSKSATGEQNNLPPQKLAFSILEAAEVLGVSRSFIYTEMEAGRLNSRYAGKRRLIPRDSVVDWLGSLPEA